MRKRKDEFVEELVSSVVEDFLQRQKERKSFEAQWSLNNNFFLGNQNSVVNSLGDLENLGKNYSWEKNGVFNHIAPIIETRLAKFYAIRPEMDIMPSSSSKEDYKVARLSQDILHSVYEKLNLSSTIAKATHWSEITGTSFYKIVWNSTAGKKLFSKDGGFLYEGEVEVTALPPYEIYPDSSSCEDINDCESIIHAKSYSTRAIKNIWGIDCSGEDINVLGLNSSFSNSPKHNQAIVIEKYESPSTEFPNGRLIVVCQNKLLYLGELPYVNLVDGKRGFPFVKQVCQPITGCFWGKSVIDKLIPIQRAYNNIKNRKQEYLNRLTMGVLTVEDGSLDLDSLEEDGLEPGKVLVYRQGSLPPKFLQEESLSSSFEKEEERLRSEFGEISGVSSVLTNQFASSSISGVALELLISEDTSKLNVSIDKIKTAVKEIAKMILRLYKQFAITPRLNRLANDKNGAIKFWKNSDLGCEDIHFLSDSTLSDSLETKRGNLLKILSSDIIKNEDGKIDENIKNKVFELFGINLETKEE